MAGLEDVFQKVSGEGVPEQSAQNQDGNQAQQGGVDQQTQTATPAEQQDAGGATQQSQPQQGDVGNEPQQTVEGADATQTNQQPAGDDAQTEVPDRLKWLSEKFGFNLDDEKQLESVVQRYKDYDALSKRVKEVEKLESENATLKEKNKTIVESLNPMSYFASEEDFKAQQLKKLYPDKDPYILQQLVTTNLSELDDIDVLVKRTLVDNPNLSGGEAGARDAVLADFLPEDMDVEEMDDRTKNRIKIAANKARREIKEMLDVDIPTPPSADKLLEEREQRMTEIKEAWKPFINDIVNPDVLEIKDDKGNKLFDFKLDGSDKDGVAEFLDAFIAAGEMKPTEENLAIVTQQRDKDLIYENLPKILTVYKNMLKSQFQERLDKELGNTAPPNTSERTDTNAQQVAGGFEKLRNKLKGVSGERVRIG